MPGPASPQGTAVYFNSVLIGWITGWNWSVESSAPVEMTHVESAVVGSGAGARVVREYDCVGVEPASFSFTFKGPPSFSASDAGMKATLQFSGGGSSWTGEAILRKFSQDARPNQYTDGTAEFIATNSSV